MARAAVSGLDGLMDQRADAVVIGAGVIGSSIAYELSRDGRRVVVVDKAGGAGHGSTSASSAIVRFNYSTWAGVALAWESLHAWRDWGGHLGGRGGEALASFRRTGMLVVPADAVGREQTTELFDRAGEAWEHWTASDIARRTPALDPGAFGPPRPVDSEEFFAPARGEVDALWTPDAGYVDDPRLAAQNLAIAAQACGASYLFHRLVTALERRGEGWRVVTSTGSIEAEVVVNAAGPWSGRINALAGVEGDFGVRTRPLRQEVHHVAAPASYDGEGAVALADVDLGTYLRPTGDGHLLVGGLEPECDPLEWVEDPDEVDLRPTTGRFRSQVTRAARRMPELGVPNRPSGVVGVYDVTDDWTPVYDCTSSAGYFVAIGTSGNQFKNAPVVGRVIAELVAAVGAGHDHDRDPVRLTLPRTGHTIDLGTFSRLRRPPEGGPSNVLG
jgi:glycine/D-amino acid oxidase-like deaminating enzyme